MPSVSQIIKIISNAMNCMMIKLFNSMAFIMTSQQQSIPDAIYRIKYRNIEMIFVPELFNNATSIIFSQEMLSATVEIHPANQYRLIHILVQSLQSSR